MKCLKHVGILLILIILKVACLNFSEDTNCDQLLKGIAKPQDCCPLPMPYVKDTSADHCIDDCKNEEEENKKKTCCIYKCAAKEFHIINNKEEIQSEGILKQYEESMGLYEEVFQKEKWIPVIKENVDICLKIVTKNNKPHCGLPSYLTWVIECVTHFNYLNCHSFLLDSEECRKSVDYMKNTVNKCGTTHNGTFIPYQDYYL